MGSVHLAGDIGGTKTTLAIINANSGPRVFLDKATFASHDYPMLEAIVKLFLKGKNVNQLPVMDQNGQWICTVARDNLLNLIRKRVELAA